MQRAGGEMVIEVEDTGIGISDDDRGKLFKMFGKLKASSYINTEGVGLGLTISKSIIDQLKGQIGLESEVGVGTTF
jgi:signal transduction histidine kinase